MQHFDSVHCPLTQRTVDIGSSLVKVVTGFLMTNYHNFWMLFDLQLNLTVQQRWFRIQSNVVPMFYCSYSLILHLWYIYYSNFTQIGILGYYCRGRQYMLNNCMDSIFVDWFFLFDWIFVHILYGFTLFGLNSSCELSESVNLEMAPPQQCFSLQPAESICSPLIGPNPLQIEGVVAPSSCRGRPWANYLQPAQQKPRLGPDPHHR